MPTLSYLDLQGKEPPFLAESPRTLQVKWEDLQPSLQALNYTRTQKPVDKKTETRSSLLVTLQHLRYLHPQNSGSPQTLLRAFGGGYLGQALRVPWRGGSKCPISEVSATKTHERDG